MSRLPCLKILSFLLMGIAGVVSMIAVYRFGKKTEKKINDLESSLNPREMEDIFKVIEPPISFLEWSTTLFSMFSGFFSIFSFLISLSSLISFSDYLLILFGVPMIVGSIISTISLYKSVYRPKDGPLPKTFRFISGVYPIVGLVSLVYAFHLGGVLP